MTTHRAASSDRRTCRARELPNTGRAGAHPTGPDPRSHRVPALADPPTVNFRPGRLGNNRGQTESGHAPRLHKALHVRPTHDLSAPNVGNDLGAELAPERLESLDLAFQLGSTLLQGRHLSGHRLELLFEFEYALDPGQVHAELRGHGLNAPQPLDVLVRVEARPLG